MRALLIDDERLALKQLQTMLESEIGGVEVVGTCTDSLRAMGLATELKPDVIFLDITMPVVNGLEVGEQLSTTVPEAKIVFVTAHRNYAVEAFELEALDYIMKPIFPNRLRKTVERVRESLSKTEDVRPDSDWPTVCCFNQLMVEMPLKDRQVMKWRTGKAEELFAFLLHHRNRLVEMEVIIELLWPGIPISKALQQLYTTIYHIRQTLTNAGLHAITINSKRGESGGNGYVLTLEETRIDVVDWEDRIKQLRKPDISQIHEHERVLDMYKGDYLGDYPFLWAEHERERLRRIWLSHMHLVSQFLIEQGELNRAVLMNLQMQQRYPFDEDSYFTLMKLYDAMGKRYEVETQFNLLTVRWEEGLGAAVDEHITEWYLNWSGGK
ncbi:response regulator [Paenibacillus contaminans]|uniref:Histidine kinase n=1 Tax=Paenibacillus contaminans TaxID=450362 RepID=A0A329MQS8_9BACL|nr:response regulator [Paenibacillus contaminans]RAV22265.1 histidine kinase [Paenibacillus contaminans]